MDEVKNLIVGAGVTGLATAAFLKDQDYLILEADSAPGGYCKTVKQDGFVWDYSGHFFHFKDAQLEAWLRQRMPGQRVLTVEKKSAISYAGGRVDFPFQKNIHQLPLPEFLECLTDLFAADRATPPPRFGNFEEMLRARFGQGICSKFLLPYNEKLYATPLTALDPDAMGRFFPHANLAEIMANMRTPDNRSYNSTFTYPQGGAVEYVNALLGEVKPSALALQEPLVGLDVARRIAHTPKRQVHYQRLVTSVPFPKLMALTGLPHDAAAWSWNKVLVFNLGFDRKGPQDLHWLYVPSKERSFYRVGFYDNIFGTPRMSLYVELGFSAQDVPRPVTLLPRVLADLKAEGIVDQHQLVSHHVVVMDPAYVHITQKSLKEVARLTPLLNAHGIYPVGRYGRWTYCSIEDNMLEAAALANLFNAA